MRYLIFVIVICFFTSCNERKNEHQYDFDDEKFVLLDSLAKVRHLDSLLKDAVYEPNLYFKISDEFYKLNDLSRSNQISQYILKKAIKQKDSLSIGRAYYYIGDCYEYTHKDSAYYFYKKAEKIFTATKNYDRLAKTHFNKGYLLFYEGVYTESELEITKALQYLKDSDNYLLQFQCLSLQGGNLEGLSLYDEALKYYQEANKILSKLDLDEKKMFYYHVLNTIDISNIYASQDKFEISLKYLNSINLSLLKQYRPVVYAKVISNIAYNQLNLYGETDNDIEEYLNESIDLITKYGNINDFVSVYQYLGELYLSLSKNELATYNFKRALNIALDSNYSTDVLNILKLLSQSDPKNFESYHTQYLDRYQALIDRQIKIKNKFARIEYDTRRIEDLNKSLSSKIQYGIYITIITILLIIMFALWRIYISNKLALNLALLKNEAEENLYSLLQEQQKLIDNAQAAEKKRIAIELHDGVMNKLYSTRLNLGILNKGNDEETIESRKKLIKEIQVVEAEIRDISHNLNNHSSDLINNYKKLLENLVASQNNLSNTKFTLFIQDEDKLSSLEPVIKFNIYRIVQEAIFNIQKHAKAKTTTISLEFFENDCVLTIADDGIGLQNSKKSGIGMSNIKHRVKLLKGKFQLLTTPGGGLTLQINFPINQNT